MGESSMNEYYEQQLTLGQEYQDFVSDILCKRGLTVRNYTSRKYQLRHGENLIGLEIKNDTQISVYGNLFIEVAERRDLCMPFMPSGIYANNSIFYLIGDYERYFLFATNTLRAIHKSGRYPEIIISRNTSRGFKLPVKDVRENLWMAEEYSFPVSESSKQKSLP
ncbi:MAG: hypothetical protein LBL62_01780 [Planctomycetaceae bacterium]|jgi:hypothetical protein|nr:hypothetical protein [Planctomycetaceae bacterium]